MPRLPQRPCTQPGCPAMAVAGRSRCAAHVRVVRDTRPSPSARGYDREWQRIRARFLRRYPACEHCGALATEVHHALPLVRGGTHDADNLVALCHRCHSRITATRDGGFGNTGREGRG